MGDRSYKLRKRYGITETVYNDILRGQGYCCKICRHEHSDDNKLHVDHQVDRDGKPWILGLLCNRCNATIAMARHSEEILLKCIQYLKTK